MQITTDQPTYDALQRYLVGVIADDVRETLHEAAATGASLEEAVQSITLGLATIIDGCRALEHDGRPIVPVLMFGELRADDTFAGTVVSNGGTSCLHEHLEHAALPPASTAEATTAASEPTEPLDPESELKAAYEMAGRPSGA